MVQLVSTNVQLVSTGVQRAGASIQQWSADGAARAEAMQASVKWQSAEEVSFEHSRTDLVPRCRDKIGRLANWVKQHPGVEVALGVRADEALTGERDGRIGPARVRTVREALIAAGVAPARIHSTTFDLQHASCTQATPACYERNRRVEVFFGQRY